MRYVCLFGSGPYVYKRRTCVIVGLNNASEARAYAAKYDGEILKRSTHVLFNGKAMSVVRAAVGRHHVAEACSVRSQWAEQEVSRLAAKRR